MVDPLLVAADLLDPDGRDTPDYEATWRDWLTTVLPGAFSSDFAPHHAEFWDWVWQLRPGVRPDPLVAIWARGHAKSTSAETAVVAVGARRTRRYVLYVSETQDQADDHVANIGDILESQRLGELYPALGDRRLGKFGSSKGWRRNRLWTKDGLIVDAVGLDTAARGIKLEDQRPDMIVIDDIDSDTDGTKAIARKIRSLTRGLIPAGSADVAVIAVQNLVHEDGVFAQLADGRAEFLTRRRLIGPTPAVEGLDFEQRDGRWVITAGAPTWVGMGLDDCQAAIDEWGISAFLAEAQHDTEPPAGGMWDHLDWDAIRAEPDDVPWHQLIRTVVWVDPAVTSTDSSDSMAIQVDAIDDTGTIWRLFSWEQRATPEAALELAIRKAIEHGAAFVGVETDQGGDTWRSVFARAVDAVIASYGDNELPPMPGFTQDKAGAGHGPKIHRSQLMLADYEIGRRIRHVTGTHRVLERALRRFPRTKPFDLADAAYWGWQDLRGRGRSMHSTGSRTAQARAKTGVRGVA